MAFRYPLGLSGITAWLPDTRMTIDEALSDGRLTPDEASATGYVSLPVSHDLAAPEMAVRAAREGLDRAGRRTSGIGFLAHAWIYYQGHDFWSPAHYVASELGATEAIPVGVQQMCNGGAAALELAASWLTAADGRDIALVTTADRCVEPGFDRWRGDYGLWYGDGATAALVHRRDGGQHCDLELLALTSRAESSVETMHRGDDSFASAPRTHSSVVDVRRTKKAFLREHGKKHFADITAVRVPEVMRAALDDADIEPTDPLLRLIALPRLGRRALTDSYYPAVAEVCDVPALDLGTETGHLGAGDLLANLAAVVRTIAPGELAAVLGAGGGFTWSCAIVRKPDHSDQESDHDH